MRPGYGDSYVPPPRRGGHPDFPRDGRDAYDGRYDPYTLDDRFDERDRYRLDERFRSPPPPPSPPRYGRDRYDAQETGYTFRGAATRDGHGDPPGQFSFRAPGPRFPSPDYYGPTQAARPPPRAPRGHSSRKGDPRGGQRGQHNGRARRFGKPPPSSREILHDTGRSPTPEQLAGMNKDGQVRFNALNSSSGESEEEGAVRPNSSSEEEGEIRRKRFKVDAPVDSKSEVPKWSNPDPYSALPPTESGPARKDIVQVIRKAKNEVAPRNDMTQTAAQNADFISFSLDDDNTREGNMREDDMQDDKASTGDAGPVHDNLDDSSSMSLSEMSESAAANITRPSNGRASAAAMSPPPGTYSANHQGLSAPPPPPPPGFIMPSDEEVARQWTGELKGRKRKHDEQSRGKGEITDEWRQNATDPTPWCIDDHSGTADVGLRLHEEIVDFFDFVRPHAHEEQMRRDLIERVQNAVRRTGGGDARDVDILCFGSFAAGLYLPTADMDLVAVSRPFMSYGQKTFCQKSHKMHQLMAHLVRCGIAQEGTTSVVAKAKVPIIKFTDKTTGIKVDISFENDSGLMANRTFDDWKRRYPAMPVLVVLVKQILAMRDLNEVFTGGLGGFSIICLVVSMLELSPACAPTRMGSQQRYSDLLLNFLDLYGNQLDVRTTGIIMRPPSYFDKIRQPMRSQNNKNLTIVDPNNPKNDISGGSREIYAVFEVFRHAHAQIMQRMSRIHSGRDSYGSMLGDVLGGNYSSFIRQRDRLYKLSTGEDVGPAPIAQSAQRPTAPKRQQRKQAKPDAVDTDNRPRKRLRSLEGNQNDPSAKEGGPSHPSPSKPKSRPTAAEKNIARASRLKKKHPDLASSIPHSMKKAEEKKFKSAHHLSSLSPGDDPLTHSSTLPEENQDTSEIKKEASPRRSKKENRKQKKNQRADSLKARFPHLVDEIGDHVSIRQAKKMGLPNKVLSKREKEEQTRRTRENRKQKRLNRKKKMELKKKKDEK